MSVMSFFSQAESLILIANELARKSVIFPSDSSDNLKQASVEGTSCPDC